MTTETFSEIGQIRPSIIKDPDATLDYSFDWTDWLAGVSDTISTYEIVGTGVTVTNVSLSGAKVIGWVSGGVVGAASKIVCKITTTAGRIEQRTIYLTIEER